MRPIVIAVIVASAGCDLVFPPGKGGGGGGGGDAADVADAPVVAGDGTMTADAPQPVDDAANGSCSAISPPCSSGLYVLSCQGKCFALCQAVNAWDDAEVACEMAGAHLASIPTPDINGCVTQLLTLSGEPMAWVGLYQNDAAGFPITGWHWFDGAIFSSFGWDGPAGEPNDADGSEADHLEQCGYSAGAWGDQPCTRGLPFVCWGPPTP